MFRKIINFLNSMYVRIIISGKSHSLRCHFPIKINNPQMISIGKNVRIYENVWLNCYKNKKNKINLTIDDNVSIGRFSQINAWEDVVIKKNVLISENVYISDVSHNYFKKNIKTKFTKPKKILINDNVWLGRNVMILPGVIIGSNSVVSANSLVNKSIPSNCIVAGNPAKIVKKISKKKLR